MTLPQEHLDDAQKLTGADGKVDLFHIQLLSGGHIYIKSDDSVTWQGHLYSGTSLALDQTGKNSDGQLPRPKFSFANPEGIYSALVSQGNLDSATVNAYRVLRTHLDSNTNIYELRVWKVRKVLSLNRNMIAVELRDPADGQMILIPARLFIPPDFPAVSL